VISTTPQSLLDFLDGCEVSVRADGDTLRFRGPADVITPELKDAMRPHKAGMLALLRIDPDGHYHSPDGGVWEEIPRGWRLICPPPKCPPSLKNSAPAEQALGKPNQVKICGQGVGRG
jgi:hypothetical protein